LLGLVQQGSYQSAAENVIEDILSVGPVTAPVEIDLMQPLDAARAPRVHEPALNHIGLWIDDLLAAYAWLEAHGVRFAPGGIRKGAAGHDVCFIHPKPSADKPESGQGVLIELVQAPVDVVAELSRS
jgi:lactoylglutathione lyase